MGLLGTAGHEAVAPDWIGHGSSSIPDSSQFAYTSDAYVAALESFVSALGMQQPFHLVVQASGCPMPALQWISDLGRSLDIGKLCAPGAVDRRVTVLRCIL